MKPYYEDNIGFEPPGYGALLDSEYRKYISSSRKEEQERNKKMTDLNQAQTPETATVNVEDLPEFLKRLQEDGEVTVQTAADVDGKPVNTQAPAPQAA